MGFRKKHRDRLSISRDLSGDHFLSCSLLVRIILTEGTCCDRLLTNAGDDSEVNSKMIWDAAARIDRRRDRRRQRTITYGTIIRIDSTPTFAGNLGMGSRSDLPHSRRRATGISFRRLRRVANAA